MSTPTDPITHHEHGGPTMSTNDQTPENTTPAGVPTPSDLMGRLRAVQTEMGFRPAPADERPAHATPLTELTEDQRTRVEALHAARRVLGNPINREGQLPAFWAETATELADYIVTGTVYRDLPAEDDEDEDEQAGPRVGGIVVPLEGELPEDMPEQVKRIVESVRAQVRQQVDPETRRANIRRYVDEHRDKPDGYKELNAQGIFPVDGSEPPRSEALHDIDGRRWTFNRDTGRWTREVLPSDVAAGPAVLSSSWGPALAEFGPFHSCA